MNKDAVLVIFESWGRPAESPSGEATTEEEVQGKERDHDGGMFFLSVLDIFCGWLSVHGFYYLDFHPLIFSFLM